MDVKLYAIQELSQNNSSSSTKKTNEIKIMWCLFEYLKESRAATFDNRVDFQPMNNLEPETKLAMASVSRERRTRGTELSVFQISKFVETPNFKLRVNS